MLLKKPPEFWTNKPLGNPGRFTLHDAAALQDLTKNHRTRMRIPEDPPTHSDNMRPLIPGYSPTCDALP
jgi:hypothetical protein